MEDMPYDFSKPVTEAFTLRAMWRLDGGYNIKYIPEYTMPTGNNELINGHIDAVFDPTGDVTYADQATTDIYGKPTQLTVNGTADIYNEYTFVHWRMVTEKTIIVNGQPTTIYQPIMENGQELTFEPGDRFIVDAKYADHNGTIYMQAVYERVSETYRRPEYANLTLDANKENYNNRPYLSDGTGAELQTSRYLQWNGPGQLALDADEDQMLFAYIQSNTAIRLRDYAITTPYFKHADGYALIGFDPEGDPAAITNLTTGHPQAYVPNFAPDSVISVLRTDNELLYAIWEPMVYANFTNETHEDLTITLTSDIGSTLAVVTKVNGVYERAPMERPYNIVIPAGETVTICAPYGAGRNIRIEGNNTLGTGFKMFVNSHIDGDHTNENRFGDPAEVTANYGDHYSITDTLVTDQTGITFTFTETEAECTLILDDNYPEGIRQERYYGALDTSSSVLPGTKTRAGYTFLGWATTPNGSATYTVNPENLTIPNMRTFFNGASSRTLYAVWEAKPTEATVYVEKIVPVPGNQTNPFTFTVSFEGSYTRSYSTSSTANTGSGTTTKNYTLQHDQYLKIETSKNPGNNSTNASISVTVGKYRTSTDEQIGTNDTFTWRRGSNGNVTWNNVVYTVTETPDQYYTTTSDVVYESQNNAVSANGNVITWTDSSTTNKGGYVTVENRRKTAHVTLTKQLVDPSVDTAKSFRFNNITLNDPANGSYELISDVVNVTSGSSGYVFENVPTGSVLTMTEMNAERYRTTVQATSGTPTITGKTIQYTVPDSDSTVTVRNELYSVPVRMIKVDQDNNPGQFGSFNVTGAGVPNTTLMPSSTTGIFYEGLMYVDTYTVTEDPFGDYIGTDRFELTVESDGTDAGTRIISSDNVNVTVSGSLTNGFEIRVMNRATAEVTIKKIFNDPLLTSGRYFRFSVSYQIGSQDPVQIGSAVNGHQVYAGDPDGLTLKVPVGSRLRIEELDANPTIWNTSAEGVWNSNENSIMDLNATDEVFQLLVLEDATVTFTNERKEVNVTVIKEVLGPGNTFRFTAQVKNGSNLLTGYNGNGFTAGEKSFNLSPSDNGTTQTTLTIPYGAVITVTETPVDGYITTVNGNLTQSFTSAAIIQDSTITFVNTEAAHIAPTGVRQTTIPFIIISGIGLMLAVAAILLKKKNNGFRQ